MRSAMWSVVILAAAACGGSSSTGNGNTGSVPDAGDTGSTPDAGGGTVSTPDAGGGTGSTPDAGGTGSTTPDAGGGGPTMFALTVTVMGSGQVVSTPAGIDCPGACTMSFAAGTQVSLAATAQSGNGLTAFSGACTGTSCSLTLNADASVTATFAATVPPADECTGLLPASLPAPVIPDLACNGECAKGDSDDGEGNFALFARIDPTFPGAGWTLFQVRDGKVVLKTSLRQSDQETNTLFSQPSGFSMLSLSSDGDSLFTFSNAGVQTHSTGLDFTNMAAVDPSGGFSVLVSAAGSSPTFSFGRYDKGGFLIAGDAVDSEGPIDVVFTGQSDKAYRQIGGAMTLTHHSLELLAIRDSTDAFDAPSRGTTGFWVDENGKRVGQPFDVPRGGTLQFLLDGSLLERATGGGFTDVWKDESSTPSPLPSWLQARASGSWLYPIRQGAGYAMGGTCSGVEVLSKNGKSCGCLAVPGVSATTSVGRDGSLIVPRATNYDLYPALFH